MMKEEHGHWRNGQGIELEQRFQRTLSITQERRKLDHPRHGQILQCGWTTWLSSFQSRPAAEFRRSSTIRRRTVQRAGIL